MPRARDLRPEFFTDEKVGELSYGQRLLYAGLWCHADLRGVFEWSPKQLRIHIFPFDESLTSGTVLEWLQVIRGLGMVGSYQSHGKEWGHVVKWAKHQQASHREVEIGSDRPMPPEWQDPPKWQAIVDKAVMSGRCRVRLPVHIQNCSGTVLEHIQNNTPSPSPSPAPAPTPSPAPTPAGAQDKPAARTAPGVGGGARIKLSSFEPMKVGIALERGELLGLIRALGGNTQDDRIAEWKRDTGGLQLGEVAVIFWYYHDDKPIREPSGFRQRREEWEATPFADRKALAQNMMDEIHTVYPPY